MPICKLVTYQNPNYIREGCGKFSDDESYETIYNYLTGNSNCSDGYYYSEKMPHNLHGSRCLDYYRAPQEMQAVAKAFDKDEGIKVRHYIMSLSQEECNMLGSSPYSSCVDLADMAEKFLDCFHGEYQCYYCVHENTDNPHVHICCSTVNFKTGRKYPGDKKSYFSIQNEMNQYLHDEYGLHLRMVPDDS